jgi:hypothetical protein
MLPEHQLLLRLLLQQQWLDWVQLGVCQLRKQPVYEAEDYFIDRRLLGCCPWAVLHSKHPGQQQLVFQQSL